MNQFPETLKRWRSVRRLSQLDLALQADISTRHISFLETGRARPSREMIARLGDVLQLPLASRNQMLTDAGFAPRYASRNWDTEQMAPVRAAISHMLSSHAPYPAIALDRLWTVTQMNAPATKLFGTLGISVGVSLLDVFMTGQLAIHIENWPQVAQAALQRLRTESAVQGGVPEFDRVVAELANVPPPEHLSASAVIPAIYRFGDMRLSLFATIAQFGTPEDVSLDDLKMELFFPADQGTEAFLKTL